VISEACVAKNEIRKLVGERLGLNSTSLQGEAFKNHQRFLNAFSLAYIEFGYYFEKSGLRNYWHSKEATKT